MTEPVGYNLDAELAVLGSVLIDPRVFPEVREALRVEDFASTLNQEIYRAAAALDDGCQELDMVINVGRLLAGDDAYVQGEIKAICDLAHSRGAKVKVIIETCYLSDAQKAHVCKLAAAVGADWVKTSTGYGTGGCTVPDVKLMRASVPEACQVKGSGGIRDLDMVLAVRAAGATRCGVSATEKIMAEAEKRFAEGTLMELEAGAENVQLGGGY